jgi:hypothetical protein
MEGGGDGDGDRRRKRREDGERKYVLNRSIRLMFLCGNTRSRFGSDRIENLIFFLHLFVQWFQQ